MTDPPARPDPELSEPWLEVANERLGRDTASLRRLTRARRGRLLDAVSTLARRGRDPAEAVDPDVVALLDLIGVDASGHGSAAREFASSPNLEAVLPLWARGGISYGFVVQRAGDVFGLPVNMSQALTTAARPGTVLLSADAATLIGPARRGRLRHRLLPHAALAEQRVATLHPPGQTSPPPGVQDGRPANA